MNKVILCGNICKDIELKYTSNNTPVMQNTIAVRNDYKNADGEYDSQFINIVAWNKTAEYLGKYAKKGNKILLEGRIQVRNYENDEGKKVWVTEIVANSVELLTPKKDDSKQMESLEKTEPVQYSNGYDLAKESVDKTDPFMEMHNQIENENLSISENDLPF